MILTQLLRGVLHLEPSAWPLVAGLKQAAQWTVNLSSYPLHFKINLL